MRICFLGIDLQRDLIGPHTEHVVPAVVSLMEDNDWKTVWATRLVDVGGEDGVAESPESELVAKWAFWPTRTIVHGSAGLPDVVIEALAAVGYDKVVLAGIGMDSSVGVIARQLAARGLDVVCLAWASGSVSGPEAHARSVRSLEQESLIAHTLEGLS